MPLQMIDLLNGLSEQMYYRMGYNMLNQHQLCVSQINDLHQIINNNKSKKA